MLMMLTVLLPWACMCRVASRAQPGVIFCFPSFLAAFAAYDTTVVVVVVVPGDAATRSKSAAYPMSRAT